MMNGPTSTNALSAYTPANAARSLASETRRPGASAFAEELRAQSTPADPKAVAEVEASAREKAEAFVAQALVQPVLKEMRSSSDAWGPFKPGQHEQSFSWLIDERIAQNIVSSENFPVVDRIAESLLQASRRGEGEAVDGQRTGGAQ